MKDQHSASMFGLEAESLTFAYLPVPIGQLAWYIVPIGESFFFTPLRGHKRVIRAIFAPGTDGATAHAADSQSQRRRHMAFL